MDLGKKEEDKGQMQTRACRVILKLFLTCFPYEITWASHSSLSVLLLDLAACPIATAARNPKHRWGDSSDASTALAPGKGGVEEAKTPNTVESSRVLPACHRSRSPRCRDGHRCEPHLSARVLRYQRTAAANAALPIFSLSVWQKLIAIIEQNCISTPAKLFHTDAV